MTGFTFKHMRFLGTLALVGLLGLGNRDGGLAWAEQGPSNVSPTDFAYPVGWLTTGPAKERMQYGYLRNRMLKTGFENVTVTGLKAARQDYESARKLCSEDPRLDYGMGLVLWVHGRKEEAVDQFEVAARLKGAMPFVPAIQAAAWGSLVAGQDERGLRLLTTLATVIGKQELDHIGEPQRHNAALVLGRAFGYLDGPGRSDQRDPDSKRAATEALAVLPANLKKDLELGRAQVAAREHELKALVAVPVDQMKAAFAEAQSQLLDDVEARNQLYRQTSQAIAKTQSERRRVLSESATKLNTLAFQMGNVNHRGAIVSRVASQLSTPQRHIGMVDVGPTYTTSDNSTSRADKSSNSRRSSVTQTHTPMYQTYSRPENACEQSARLNLLWQSLSQMQHIETQATKLRMEAQEIHSKRKTAIEQNAQAAKILQDELRGIRRDKLELSQQLQKLVQSHRSLIELKANADSLLAYVPWDVENQRTALTKSYFSSR